MQRTEILLILLLLTPVTGVTAQRTLTLSEAVELAQRQSVDAAAALSELKSSYWEYRTYRADLLPEVNLTATLPDYRRSYNLYQGEDGAYRFVRTNSLGISGEITVDQNVRLTGGKLSFNTSLQYIDPLNGAGAGRNYMSVPAGITYTQPLFGVNTLKWRSRIEPVRYSEAKATYLEQVEIITLRTITHYFDLLLAGENLHIARQNRENADRIYTIAVARRRMGQISENELLQLELSALKAASNLTREQSTYNSAMFRLRSFLALSENDIITPLIPEMEAYPAITYHDVLEKAQQNNPFAHSLRRRQLQADFEVAQAKGAQRQVDLFASVGYTGRDHSLHTAYRSLIDYQVAEAGIKIPLLDWGKRKGRVKVAESNRNLIASRLKQEQTDFNQNIFLLVEQYNHQAEQLRIAREADAIALKRYSTSVESFMIGKINTLDLNDAQLSKDSARAAYLSEMHLYWYCLYRLRSLTLHDFAKGTGTDADFERLVRD